MELKREGVQRALDALMSGDLTALLAGSKTVTRPWCSALCNSAGATVDHEKHPPAARSRRWASVGRQGLEP